LLSIKKVREFLENLKDDLIVNPLILKPDPFSKCPEEIQIATYKLMKERIEKWRKRHEETLVSDSFS